MNDHKRLTVLGLQDIHEFLVPEGLPSATLDSPAMSVVTDFHSERALILESDTTVDEADLLMKKAHVHMKLVVDKNERFLGIVSLSMLESHDVLQMAGQRGVARPDLTVADVMVPADQLPALSYAELQSCTIGDVLHALRDLGQNHILVLDEDQQRISGIVSASDIARFLHVPIDIVPRATTFVEVVDALAQ